MSSGEHDAEVAPPDPSSHVWFAVERPTDNGTVFVKPPAADNTEVNP